MSNLSLEDGTWTITPAGGNIVGVDIVRQYVPNSNQGGNTIAYEGYTPEACTLAEITVFMKSLNTQGTYTVTFTNVTTGNTVLSTANFDMQTLTANTWTALTLTGTSSDLTFAADDRFRVVFASNNASFDGSGVYFSMRFTSNTSYTPRAMELIFSTTLTSTATTITTGTLATGYSGLILDVVARSDNTLSGPSSVMIAFNGDNTLTNYQAARAIFRGGTYNPVAGEAFDTALVASAIGSAHASRFATSRILILGHERTDNYKSWQSTLQGIAVPTLVNPSYYFGQVVVGTWENTNAITTISLSIYNNQYDFVAGTSVSVYGLR